MDCGRVACRYLKRGIFLEGGEILGGLHVFV